MGKLRLPYHGNNDGRHEGAGAPCEEQASAVRVGVTGATGFVGRGVVAALRARGDDVTALTRDLGTARFSPSVRVKRFDVNDPEPNPAALDELDAVIHLAGETVDGRWTPEKKRKIHDSRVSGTRNLVASLAACSRPPRVLASGSAIGFYGDRGDEPLDETSAPGSDFLARLCVGWEREAQAAARLGIRVALVRVSMVLGRDGGAVGKLKPIFSAGIGGPLGAGRQWMPWIHIDDIASLFCFVLDREDINGPICAVAPDYATNARVMAAIGHALGRPALMPAPAFALHLVVGEYANTLLGGQLIIPAKALDAGFSWKHSALEQALIDLLAPHSGRAPAVQTFRNQQIVRAPIERVFSFMASSLARVTPPEMNLETISPAPDPLRRGCTLDYRLRIRGLGITWRSMISEWVPGVHFADVQVRGPFALWRHSHDFEEVSGGVVVRDRIDYALPLAPLSNIALPAARRDIEKSFAFRRRALEEIFAG